MAFEPEFANDNIHQVRWRSFIRKKKAMLEVGFGEVIHFIQRFLEPVIESVVGEKDFEMTWDYKSRCWK